MNVELRNIHKRFGAVHANAGISLSIAAGSIHGILGENGAGKSTLMKILSGYYRADYGEILLSGRPVSIPSPADAVRHGIGMLHQDPLDFPPMTVVDSFLVGGRGHLFVSRRKTRQALLTIQQKFGFDLDPDAYVDSLTVGERQQLELLRLLWLRVEVLILDEPTTGISAHQKEKLFNALRLLAREGKAVILVSHKLPDVQSLCDRVSVLRAGEVTGHMDPPYNTDRLVELMFGKQIALPKKQGVALGETVFELRNLVLEDARLKVRMEGIRIRAGEVIGVAGMEGSGQRLLLRACTGLVRPISGRVLVRDKDMTRNTYLDYHEQEISFVPANRLEEGLVPGMTLAEHFMLVNPGRGPFIQKEAAVKLADENIRDFCIRGTPESLVESLSGGNQQRALLSLQRQSLSLLVLEQPTRGLDVESAVHLWAKLQERCRQGTSILFVSSDLDEILQYSDRILVFFSGQVSAPMDAASATVDQLGLMIGGKGPS